MPKTVFIQNKNRNIAEPPRILYCDTFLTQLRGLTFRSRLSPTEGLVLVGKRDSRLDSSIHMLFVSFDLTVLWVNASMQVVDKVLAKSWRPAYISKQPATYVVELHPNQWDNFNLGDTVEFSDA